MKLFHCPSFLCGVWPEQPQWTQDVEAGCVNVPFSTPIGASSYGRLVDINSFSCLKLYTSGLSSSFWRFVHSWRMLYAYVNMSSCVHVVRPQAQAALVW